MSHRITMLFVLGVVAMPSVAAPPTDVLGCTPHMHSLATVQFSFLNAACRHPRISKEAEQALKTEFVRRYGFDVPQLAQKEAALKRFQAELSVYQSSQPKLTYAERIKKEADEVAADNRRAAEERQQKLLAREQWQQKEAADAKADREAKQAALAERAKRLRSGEIKVTTFDDAKLYHTPVANLLGLMAQPLLKPDGAMYAEVVMLDAQEKDGTLRTRVQTVNGIAYAMLRLRLKSIQITPEQLRLNSYISVVGQYVDNQEYVTLNGQTRTAPVLDVAFIQP